MSGVLLWSTSSKQNSAETSVKTAKANPAVNASSSLFSPTLKAQTAKSSTNSQATKSPPSTSTAKSSSGSGAAAAETTPSSTSSNTSSSSLSTGAQAGIGVGAAAAGIAVIGLAMGWYFARRKAQRNQDINEEAALAGAPAARDLKPASGYGHFAVARRSESLLDESGTPKDVLHGGFLNSYGNGNEMHEPEHNTTSSVVHPPAYELPSTPSGTRYEMSGTPTHQSAELHSPTTSGHSHLGQLNTTMPASDRNGSVASEGPMSPMSELESNPSSTPALHWRPSQDTWRGPAPRY